MHEPKIEFRDPVTLRRHPTHKAHVPEPDKDSEEWKGFVETLRADGRVREPLRITKDGLVMDGWYRREGAKDLQFDSVPCIVDDESEAALLMVETLTARKQMTRGAAVYLALGAMEEYAAAAERRRHRNLAARRKTTEQPVEGRVSGTRQPGSIRYLAERWGCNHDTVHKAMQIRATLHDPKEFARWITKDLELQIPEGDQRKIQADLRAEMEPLLFNGQKSLWSILQAAGGRLSTVDRPKVTRQQLELFTEGVGTFITRFTYWCDLDESSRSRAMKDIHRHMELMPPDRRKAMAEFLAKLLKEVRTEKE